MSYPTTGHEVYVRSFYSPVRSNGGVYSALAAVRSWVKPSRMPQFSMYATAERDSEQGGYLPAGSEICRC